MSGRKTNCTPEIAFEVWKEAGKPSMRELKDVLAKRGYSVHNATLGYWKDRIPEWQASWAAKEAPLRPERIIKSLQQAAMVAPQLKCEHFTGVKAQLVARLYDAIKEMPFASIDDWMRGLDCCERIESLIHAERGKAVAEAASTLEGAAKTLAQRIGAANGSVVLAPFKKPAGAA